MIAKFSCPNCKTNLRVNIDNSEDSGFIWTLSEMKLILRLRSLENPTMVAVHVEKGQPQFAMVFDTKTEVFGGDRLKVS